MLIFRQIKKIYLRFKSFLMALHLSHKIECTVYFKIKAGRATRSQIRNKKVSF